MSRLNYPLLSRAWRDQWTLWAGTLAYLACSRTGIDTTWMERVAHGDAGGNARAEGGAETTTGGSAPNAGGAARAGGSTSFTRAEGGSSGVAEGGAGEGGVAEVTGEAGTTAACPGHAGPTMVLLPPPLDFCIDSTEVTRADYESWLDMSPPPEVATVGPGCSGNSTIRPDESCLTEDAICGGNDCDQHPAVCIDWCDAYAYCQEAGKYLCGKPGGGESAFWRPDDPSESQWHAACSDSGSRVFPYGMAYDAAACNGADLARDTTVPVASLGACQGTYLGLYDLSGNVWEWENSCDTTVKPVSCRLRGGSYAQVGSELSCSDGVSRLAMTDSLPRVGFRCCADR